MSSARRCLCVLRGRACSPILAPAIAAIGFAFDIYEILMLPLIVRPALLELTGAVPGSPEFQMWVGRLFYIPAFAGGIFGLLPTEAGPFQGKSNHLSDGRLVFDNQDIRFTHRAAFSAR